VVNYVARNFDNLLVGRYVGAHALGLYSKAYDLLMLPIRQISEPATAVAIPSLSRITDDADRYRNAFLRMLEKVLLLSLPLGAFLMAASDALIEVVLGPRWSGAGPIFFWLGWLTFSQPLGNAMGWLFVSQGRTSELFRWGVLGASLAVASFFAGLPWGVEGVAMAYSLSGLVLRTPIVLWMACRNGPVHVAAVLRTALPVVLAALASLGAGLAARRLAGPIHPVWSLLMTSGACVGTMLMVLLPFASGRRALADLLMIADFRRRFSA
jgi:PST family polysaccharide transporter